MIQDEIIKQNKLKELIKERDYYTSLKEPLSEELKEITAKGETDEELVNILNNLESLIKYTKECIEKVLHNKDCQSKHY
jgi:predicted house-cleaning noncanonical NTP pyrophosphatase (MazG superfamily)